MAIMCKFRAVARKSSIGELYVFAGGLTFVQGEA